MKLVKKLSTLLLLLTFVVGCSAQTSSKETEEFTLHIGLMPAVDSAPIFLAKKNGYFEELNLNLNETVYTNANNRQSALQSGELDGTMTDLIAYINNQHNGFDTKIVNSTDGSFAFLVNDEFENEGNKQTGLMEISVANYLTDTFITPDYQVDKVFIPEIPTRLEMLNTGKLDIAFIPEPVASLGQLSGLEKLVSITDDDGYTPEAMVFTPDAIAEKSDAIELFIQGYNKAVEAIAQDDALAREVLIQELDLNPEINKLINLPEYQKARVPSEAYLNKIINWVESVQEIDVRLQYEEMIDGRFTQS